MCKPLIPVLAAILTGLTAGSAQEVRIVRLTTSDDVAISAAYFPPVSNSAPAVILLPDFGKNREEWTAFAAYLQRNGFAALAIDLRGHGDSTRRLTTDGLQTIDYHSFTPRDFTDMLLDANAAFDWLSRQSEINTRRIAVAGSGLGANLALRYGLFNDEVVAFLILSPSMVNQGVRADDAITKLGVRPLRIVVSQEDGFPFESSKHLAEIRKDSGQAIATNELIVCTGLSRGAAILNGVKGLPEDLLAWLKQVTAENPPTPRHDSPAGR